MTAALTSGERFAVRIDSPVNWHFFAMLAVGDDGIDVEIWYQPFTPSTRRRLHADTLDCPMHVALDRTHDLLMQIGSLWDDAFH